MIGTCQKVIGPQTNLYEDFYHLIEIFCVFQLGILSCRIFYIEYFKLCSNFEGLSSHLMMFCAYK